MENVFTFPTHDEWLEIAQTFPHKQIEVPEEFLQTDAFNVTSDPLSKLINGQEAEAWARHLINRLGDVYISYIMLSFYFNKGIPDDNWWGPGEGGRGVAYFPNFKESDHFIHKQFCYYADTFFYKIFTSWDTIGQFLNNRCDLKFDKKDVSFKRIVNALNQSEPELHEQLISLVHDSDFKEVANLRNEVAHRFSPHSVDAGIVVRKTEKSQAVDITVGNYVTSKQMKKYVDTALCLMGKTLQIVKQNLNQKA